MFWEQLQFLITQICFLLLVYLHMCGSRGRGVLGGILVLMVYVWPFQCNRSTHECRFNSHICLWEISLIPEVRLSFRNRIRISLKGILNKHTRPLKHCHSWIIRFQWTLTSKFELGNWSPSLRKIKKQNEKKERYVSEGVKIRQNTFHSGESVLHHADFIISSNNHLIVNCTLFTATKHPFDKLNKFYLETRTLES